MKIPEISIQISANSVAWYGAIIATIGASVSIYNAWKDCGQIKITYQKGMRIMNAIPPWSEDKDYFIVNITNTGRRPIAVGNVAIQYISGENFILVDSIDNQSTRILTEEKPHTMITTDQSLIDFSKIYCIIVYDKVSREYKKYLFIFPTFKKVIYKLKLWNKKIQFTR